ncbi:putative membrane protein YhiD involved in acid resistance [Flavobacterium sp. CG_9.1]|uniref:hypothetical protein n=1 Tax=Flavobacterium sp. CG_9.1 TaxID=2787728 RepID=UPI0018C998C6|nr:hypothetical protein [Flavobacterium sp. CG_9.1]MBG6062849.1 putative membrane protein YhiD involved in acid resistance [Flavobacterium sp. CG_9.1]
MRKIIVVTVLIFIALFALPLKKKYIPKKESTYIKTNIKVDAPDLIMNNTNENDVLEEKDKKFKDSSIFYQTPKPAFIQHETDTIKSIIYSRNKKGKMMYRKNTSESILK